MFVPVAIPVWKNFKRLKLCKIFLIKTYKQDIPIPLFFLKTQCLQEVFS
jgi:hypothetical protein